MNAPVVVYTAGCFDLFHRGHLNLLWRSKQLGDILVVGVVSDASYKDVTLAQPYFARAKAIKSIPWVDMVEYQEGTDPSDVLERVRPDIMTHADDWTRLKEGHETLERLGIRWVVLPYTPEISSTALRENGEP